MKRNNKNIFDRFVYGILICLVFAFFVPVVNNDAKAVSGYWSNYYSTSSPGSGTSSSPYLVYNASQLARLSNTDGSSLCFKLMADIDLGAHYWQPPINFIGQINGNGKTISNLNIDGEYKNCGFIGSAYGGAKVYNIYFKNADIKSSYSSGDSFVGGVCGYVYLGTFEKIFFSGNVCSYNNGPYVSYAGGIVGELTSINSIKECYVKDSNIRCSYSSGSRYAGGIAGKADAAISDCIVAGTVIFTSTATYSSSTSYAGKVYAVERPALFGWDWNRVQFYKYIRDVYLSKAAGICPYIDSSGSVTNCYVTRNTVSSCFGTRYYSDTSTWSSDMRNDKSCGAGDGKNIGNHLKDSKWIGYTESKGSYGPETTVSKDNYEHLIKTISVSWPDPYKTITDTRVYEQTIAYETTSNCFDYAPTSVPSGYSSSIWAVHSKIDSGKLHLKWMYWQDQV